MKTRYLTLALPILVAASAARADSFGDEPKTGLFIGETALMGNGTVRSWVDLGPKFKPNKLGITFTDLALEGLPTEGEPEFRVKLPKQAWLTPFEHVAVNWNPHGHEPPGIYDVPHFDFHFYMVTAKERSKMTLDGNGLDIFRKPVPDGYLPPDYFMAIGTEVPFMGIHCIDGTSPELHGAPFTSTLIYGAYNGKVHFIEPMVALSVIEARQDVILPIKQPKYVRESGYYPTVYAIVYDGVRQETSIELREFVWRTGRRERH